jgi:hypothetical protein
MAVVVSLTILSFLSTYTVGDGLFPQAQFRIKFVDSIGKPIEGVQLAVIDASNKDSPYYPVSDYSRKQSLRSNANGVITFHHICGGIEFSCHCCRLLWIIPIGSCSSPSYYCMFTWRSQVVYRCTYAELYRDVDLPHLRHVTMKWKVDEELLRLVRRDIEDETFPIIEKTITVNIPEES